MPSPPPLPPPSSLHGGRGVLFFPPSPPLFPPVPQGERTLWVFPPPPSFLFCFSKLGELGLVGAAALSPPPLFFFFSGRKMTPSLLVPPPLSFLSVANLLASRQGPTRPFFFLLFFSRDSPEGDRVGLFFWTTPFFFFLPLVTAYGNRF